MCVFSVTQKGSRPWLERQYLGRLLLAAHVAALDGLAGKFRCGLVRCDSTLLGIRLQRAHFCLAQFERLGLLRWHECSFRYAKASEVERLNRSSVTNEALAFL